MQCLDNPRRSWPQRKMHCHCRSTCWAGAEPATFMRPVSQRQSCHTAWHGTHSTLRRARCTTPALLSSWSCPTQRDPCTETCMRQCMCHSLYRVVPPLPAVRVRHGPLWLSPSGQAARATSAPSWSKKMSGVPAGTMRRYAFQPHRAVGGGPVGVLHSTETTRQQYTILSTKTTTRSQHSTLNYSPTPAPPALDESRPHQASSPSLSLSPSPVSEVSLHLTPHVRSLPSPHH